MLLYRTFRPLAMRNKILWSQAQRQESNPEAQTNEQMTNQENELQLRYFPYVIGISEILARHLRILNIK